MRLTWMVNMKKLLLILFICLMLTAIIGCSNHNTVQLAASTLPVFEFTSRLCEGTDLRVGRLVTESVSCLHDYSLQVSQMRMIEEADSVIISGAGLEDFLSDILADRDVIDASENISLICPPHNDEHDHDHSDHHHETDPHFWLSPNHAKSMTESICTELCQRYPHYTSIFKENLVTLQKDFDNLQEYGMTQLSELTTRELVTFHDGFSYFAESFDLTILESIEEESGSEASAAQIIHLVDLVEKNALPAIFVETNGSDACAGIIHNETDVEIYMLDMAMAGNSYFDAMYHNIDTVKEALG